MRSTNTRPGSVDWYAEQASAHLGEPVLAAQQFYPCGYWKIWVLGRLGRLLLGKRRLDDLLPQFNLLVVTPSRVAVFGVNFSYRSDVRLTGPHGTWQRSAVTATKKRVKLVTGGARRPTATPPLGLKRRSCACRCTRPMASSGPTCCRRARGAP